MWDSTVRVLSLNLCQLTVEVGSFERQMSGEQFINHHSKTEDVRACIDLLSTPCSGDM